MVVIPLLVPVTCPLGLLPPPPLLLLLSLLLSELHLITAMSCFPRQLKLLQLLLCRSGFSIASTAVNVAAAAPVQLLLFDTS